MYDLVFTDDVKPNRFYRYFENMSYERVQVSVKVSNGIDDLSVFISYVHRSIIPNRSGFISYDNNRSFDERDETTLLKKSTG